MHLFMLITLNIRFFVLHIEFGIDSTFTAFSNYLLLLLTIPYRFSISLPSDENLLTFSKQ